MTKRRIGLAIVIAVLLLAFGAFVVWPAVDRQLMRIPMTDGVAALRSGNLSALQACFTADAVVTAGDAEMPVADVLRQVAPLLSARSDRRAGSFRFAGYVNPRQRGRVVESDFKIVVEVDVGEDNPYRMNPTVERMGEVTLIRQGLFTWKIARIGLKDREWGRYLRLLRGIPGGAQSEW